MKSVSHSLIRKTDLRWWIRAYVIMGCMYFASGAVVLFGLGAVWLQRIKLVQTYFYLSILAALSAVGAQVAQLVFHFIYKVSPVPPTPVATSID